MKLLISLSIFFASALAFACPDLSGTYQCEKDPQDPADTGVLLLSSVVDNGAFYYVYTDADEPNNPAYLPTDGQEYKDENGSSYKGSCSDSKFVMNIVTIDPQYGPITIQQNVSKTAQADLLIEGTAIVNGSTYPFSSTCTKK